MDKDSMTFAAAAVAVIGGVASWFWAVFRGGRQSAADRAAMLKEAADHAEREIDKVRAHSSVEHDKIWTRLQRVEERAEADRLVLTEVKSDVHYIRSAVDRIAARLDNRKSD